MVDPWSSPGINLIVQAFLIAIATSVYSQETAYKSEPPRYERIYAALFISAESWVVNVWDKAMCKIAVEGDNDQSLVPDAQQIIFAR